MEPQPPLNPEPSRPPQTAVPTAPLVAPTPKPLAAAPRPRSFVALILLVLAVLLALGGAYWWFVMNAAEETPESASEPFVIGGIGPLTGDAASFGVPIQQAAMLAQKEINAMGGIGGRPIEMRWEDGRCESDDALAGAEQLLTDGVDFLIAGACSGEFLAAAPLAQAKGIISYSAAATNPDISKLGRLVFRTAPSDALAGKVAAGYAYEKLGARSAAIISENEPYTQGLRAVFSAEFAALGGEVVVDEVYETGASSFAGSVAAIKAANPDVVYILPQSPTPGVLIVKELKDAGVTAQLLTAEVLLIRDAIVEQGEILEGVTGIEVLFDDQNPKARELLADFEAEFGLEPIYPSFMAGIHDIMYLLKEAYEATDGSSEAIADYFYNIDNWNGAVGQLSFDENGDPALSYSIRTIENGEAPVVDTYTPAP